MSSPGSASSGTASPAGPNVRSYREIWSKEIEFNHWGGVLDFPTSGWITSGWITIMDIAPSGDLAQWRIASPGQNESLETWIRTHRELLRTTGSGSMTRLIVFERTSDHWARELIGLHYDIEPEFFKDVALRF
ncbi:hypothetical protein A1O3_10139 [Capronia epimyces CBS 606.96]|uniref:Uncharacterized protein n=1 Tax=Capronia epimyces CBS 606.96 TaxID=1182542 RepID=W9X941_9EURO|nr:uncharacterized protein A1O3_10139 [Capronia epimyces CBS 606.96]EXJ76982.1 hypothetical protein A1O3_10139 [Capronia epimyces CBS 606.96]